MTTKCRVCGTEIIKFFSLGDMPLANAFRKKKDTAEKKYDLSVGFCRNCYLVQLAKNLDPKEIFEDYIYFSSTTKTVLEHSKETAKYLKDRLNLNAESLVVEIGSNDGVQLQYFKKLGMQILGIDPAKNIIKVARKKGIKTLASFFNYSFAKKLVSKNIKADLILGANILAHVPDILDFIKGVKLLIRDKGTAVFEFPYLKGLLDNKFDTIYHEHVFYYSMLALRNLFNEADLEVYDVEYTKMQGGSLRIFVSHSGIFLISSHVTKLINTELEKGFDKIQTYKRVDTNVKKLKIDLTSLLIKLKAENKTIAAYGAPAKGIILLTYFDISKYLDFIVDIAFSKQGFYTPGSHMKVYPPEKIFKEKPDYLLILCWNISDEVIQQMKPYRELGGKFIIPIPSIRIL